MRLIFIGFLLTAFNAYAETITTPGAIASLPVPDNAPHQYLSYVDMVTIGDGQQYQITVGVLPAVKPRLALKQVLISLDASQYTSQIKDEKIAGAAVASVHAKNESSDWWMVIEKPQLNLFVRVQDANDAFKHKPYLEKLVKQVRYAPASHPQLVVGHYTMSSNYSGSYDNSISVYGESSIGLLANGVFSTSGYVGVTGADVSGLSQGGGDRGWWQVRGNRMLSFEPPDTFYNYRFEAFSNGLHVYTENNEKLLWVRK